MELGCLAVEPHRTAEAIKPAGANGEGGVEFAGVFCAGLFLLASILHGKWRGVPAVLARAVTPGRLVLFL